MKYLKLTVVLFTIALVSCQSAEDKAWEETMVAHDEIMVKMQENGPLESKFNLLIERAQKDSSSVLFTKLDLLKSALHKLEVSDEEMMDWMASIRNPHTYKGDEDYVTYILSEKEEILEVGVRMDEARTHGEAVLKSIEQ